MAAGQDERNPWAALPMPSVVLLALVVFAVDFHTPAGFAHSALYLPCILLAALRREPRGVIWIAALCIVLALAYIPFFDVPVRSPGWWIALGNRLVAVLLLAATALASLHLLRVLAQRDRARTQASAQELALEEEQRLRRIACEAGTLGGWSVDLATGTLHVSDLAARIQGFPEDVSPTVEQAFAVYAPEDQARIRRLYAGCADAGRPFDEEFQLATRDHRWVWVRVIGLPVRDPDGRIVRVHGAMQDISERKRLQSTVAAGNRWFSQVADSLPLVVWSANVDGDIEYLNRRVLDYTGEPLEQLLGKDGWLSIVHPDDRAQAQAAWIHSVRTGETFQCEYRMRNRHGRYRWYQVRAVPAHGIGGDHQRWVGSATDIHDLRKAEQQARHLGERLTTTLESITEGFFLLDREWRISFVNPRAETLLESSRSELLGRTIWEAYAPVVGTVFEDEYRKAMASGESTSFLAHYPPLAKWFEVHAYPSAEGLAVYFQDVTARREHESRRRLLEAAVGQINDIVMITDARPVDFPGPRIVFANQAFERRMGFTAGDVIGQTPRILQGAGTSPAERARIRAALEAGEPVRATLDNYTRDGERVVLEMDIAPVHDEAGVLTHFVSVERDVTEQAARQARLEQAQRMESIGQLTGGLAHDFNNLLTVILGSSEALVESLPGDGRAHELASMIAGASERAAGLVQRLLAFARQQALEPRSVDVAALVGAWHGLLQQAMGSGIVLDVLQDDCVGAALVDPEQLESALLNLCMNAGDALPQGGRVQIRIARHDVGDSPALDLAPGPYVRITVADTGAGIPPELQARVFEPFFTTRQRAGHTGLGLSMVYGFAKQSRGHLALESQPGAGTRVHLYLPAAQPIATDAAASSEPGGPPAAPDVQRRRCILVVDDNDLVRDYACEQLGALGYEVLAVSDGETALRVLEAGTPVDLVFSDMVMPGLSGAELAQRVRAMRPALPVLLTSGFADAAQYDDAQGAFPLLGKPYRSRDLAEAVARVLRDAGDTAPA